MGTKNIQGSQNIHRDLRGFWKFLCGVLRILKGGMEPRKSEKVHLGCGWIWGPDTRGRRRPGWAGLGAWFGNPQILSLSLLVSLFLCPRLPQHVALPPVGTPRFFSGFQLSPSLSLSIAQSFFVSVSVPPPVCSFTCRLIPVHLSLPLPSCALTLHLSGCPSSPWASPLHPPLLLSLSLCSSLFLPLTSLSLPLTCASPWFCVAVSPPHPLSPSPSHLRFCTSVSVSPADSLPLFPQSLPLRIGLPRLCPSPCLAPAGLLVRISLAVCLCARLHLLLCSPVSAPVSLLRTSLPRLASTLSPPASLHPSSPSLRLPGPPPAPAPPPPSERVNFGEGPGVPGW